MPCCMSSVDAVKCQLLAQLGSDVATRASCKGGCLTPVDSEGQTGVSARRMGSNWLQAADPLTPCTQYAALGRGSSTPGGHEQRLWLLDGPASDMAISKAQHVCQGTAAILQVTQGGAGEFGNQCTPHNMVSAAVTCQCHKPRLRVGLREANPHTILILPVASSSIALRPQQKHLS
jgi:hypothetical protein